MRQVALISLSQNDALNTPTIKLLVFIKTITCRQTYTIVLQILPTDNTRRKHGDLLGPNISMQNLDPNSYTSLRTDRQTFPAVRLTLTT